MNTRPKQILYETRFTGNVERWYRQAEIIKTGVDGSVSRTVVMVGSILEIIEKYPGKK